VSSNLRKVSFWCLALTIALACGSQNGDDDDSNGTCVVNHAVACVGPGNCEGRQVCNQDGSSYSECQCSVGTASTTRASATTNVDSGAMSPATGGMGATHATNRFGSSVVTSSPSTSASGGVSGIAGAAGAGAQPAATSAHPDGTTASVCAPADMTNFAYPPYKPARRASASCTEAELEQYYAECYATGACTTFQPGGASATCGECLKPSAPEDAAYGPMLRLGPANAPMNITNIAGCIELLGEADCAKPMMVAALCEYYACADNCPNATAQEYQAEMDCMAQARTTTCSAVGNQAVCINDPAHAATCSGNGFANQFKAIARVFCVQGA
jgi:hypothetical protein